MTKLCFCVFGTFPVNFAATPEASLAFQQQGRSTMIVKIGPDIAQKKKD